MGKTNGDEKMKIYTDWYDGRFFCSVITEEKLRKVKGLVEKVEKFIDEVEMCESLSLTIEDLCQIIKDAKDINDEELEVLRKFGVKGFDIYEEIPETLIISLREWNGNRYEPKITLEELEELKKSGLGEDWMYRLVENDIKNYRSTEGN